MKCKAREVWVGCGLALLTLAGSARSQQASGVELWNDEPSRQSGDSATLDGYITDAVANSPTLESARQEWKAALERAGYAGSLPDPVLSYGYFLEEVETRVGPQKQRLGISQAYPWFGTLGTRKDAALAGAEAARQRYVLALLTLTREVRIAYADYYDLSRARAITRDNLELLRFWERILNARYTTGKAGYSNLLRVQVELGKLEDRLRTLEEQRAPRISRLNDLMNLPPETTLPWPEWLPELPALPERDAILRKINEDNPELSALRAMIEKEEAGAVLANKAGYPDFAFGLDWVQTDRRTVDNLADNGKDPIMARVAVHLPLWRGKVNAKKREAAARREAAEARLESRGNRLASEVSNLLFRYEDAERKIDLYKDSLIPKGNQSLEAAYSAFETGEADFLNVLDAQRALLEFELSLEGARADRLRARASIDALTGRRNDPR